MTSPLSPILDPYSIEPRTSNLYPKPHDQAVQGRSKRSLTQALGLTQFGANLTELQPGGNSALRHWHSHEDEMVFVLSGELTLVSDAGEQVLRAGQCVGFPAGVPNGHHLFNRSQQPVTYLELGSRDDRDEVVYPDVDLHAHPGRYTSPPRFTHKDGTPFVE